MAKAEYLTNAGQELLAQASAGLITLEFTKIQMGSGTLPTGQSRRTRTALVHPEVTLEINSVKVSEDNTVAVEGIFDNSSLTEGFYYREKGVFASDGESEVLMFYMNSGDDAEWIEPPTVELVEKRIVSLYKGSQEESYSIQTKSGIYITTEEYEVDMGSESIAGIGDGTVRGAISSIRSFIANLEQSVASQAYAKGEYLVKGNSLRKVISAIASGGAITNSNTSETDVGKELTQINNSLTEINTDLSVQSVTTTTVTNTYLQNITITAKRSGNVVSVVIGANTKASIPIDANFQFGTISAIPAVNTAISCDRVDGGHVGARVSISGGNVSLRTTTTIPSGVWISAYGTYVCN